MQAARFCSRFPDFRVAVNLSARQLRDHSLVESVAAALRASGLKAHCLELEITESVAIENVELTLGVLGELRKTGVRIAIDDFGTGHSSLASLKQLPVDEIKIDRSFIQDVATDETDRVIVRCTVDLAHSLGLRVVADGVEDAETYALVAELGCDEAQGLHLSPALRRRALTSWISQQPLAA